MRAFDIKEHLKKVFETFKNEFLTRACRFKEYFNSFFQSLYLSYTDEFQNNMR